MLLQPANLLMNGILKAPIIQVSLNQNADVYIIAVSDDAIDDVIADIQLPKKVVAHTAASVSKDILKNVS